MKFSPILNRVLVRPDEVESVSKGGILIPEKAREVAKSGRVLAIGPGKPDEPMTVCVGDEVLWTSQYNTVEARLGGEKLLVLNEDDLLGVIA